MVTQQRKKLIPRLFSGLNWALYGYIISSILIIVYVYNIDPASISIGDPNELLTVKTLFGYKTFYPEHQFTPLKYGLLLRNAYIGMGLILLVLLPDIIKDGRKARKKYEELK